MPGYFIMQVWWPLRMSGVWRIAALAPLVILLPLLLHAIVAFAMQSNLWPILIIFFAPFGFCYLAGLGVAHYLRR